MNNKNIVQELLIESNWYDRYKAKTLMFDAAKIILEQSKMIDEIKKIHHPFKAERAVSGKIDIVCSVCPLPTFWPCSTAKAVGITDFDNSSNSC